MAELPNSIGVLAPLVGYHLRRASTVFAFDFARAVDGTNMRQVLFAILAVVAENPGINQGAVGRVLGIKRANMVSLINELFQAGLVAREADPGDRRALSLTPTAAGTAMLQDCYQRIERHEQGLLSSFTADEKAMLLDLLGRIERRDLIPD